MQMHEKKHLNFKRKNDYKEKNENILLQDYEKSKFMNKEIIKNKNDDIVDIELNSDKYLTEEIKTKNCFQNNIDVSTDLAFLDISNKYEFFCEVDKSINKLVKTERYENSYMHKDVLSHIICMEKVDFIITISNDGMVYFWKKVYMGIEFVKKRIGHSGKISDLDITLNQHYMLTCSDSDNFIKVFDVINFDVVTFLKLPFKPYILSVIKDENISSELENIKCLINPINSNIIFLLMPSKSDLIYQSYQIHDEFSLVCLKTLKKSIISIDSEGFIEIWKLNSNYDSKNKLTIDKYKEIKNSIKDVDYPDNVNFSTKLETDLFFLNESKKIPNNNRSLFISKTEKFFVIGISEIHFLIYLYATAKIIGIIDESVDFYTSKQSLLNSKINNLDNNHKANTDDLAIKENSDFYYFGLNIDDFTKKINDFSANIMKLTTNNTNFNISENEIGIDFDEYDQYLYITSRIGVKLFYISEKVFNKEVKYEIYEVALIGKSENLFFNNVKIFQGSPQINSTGIIGNGGISSQGNKLYDPLLICTCFNSNRFYIFSTREAICNEKGESNFYDKKRDIMNEKLTLKELELYKEIDIKDIPNYAILDTSHGEIHIILFPKECPKTVKNFVELSNSGFYKNMIFHRVIKGFMIQTGCQYNNGKGSHSIYNGEFEDEFSDKLKHDVPYTVAMANKGPNTNGSQFYITTNATSWLDNKHTVFGRVYKGIDVVQEIENVECKGEKPVKDVRLYQIRIINKNK